jgi:hypothetical protein
MKIAFTYKSAGTFYGTVTEYDAYGNPVGPKSLTNLGVFFVVKRTWDKQVTANNILISKSVGTGITVNGNTFTVAFRSSDLDFAPSQYFYNAWIGTTINGTITDLSSIGSGVFEILEGAFYGTN